MSNFNYYHGGDAERFRFFRIPQALISDKRFQALSIEAKLLYTFLLDRMGLSLCLTRTTAFSSSTRSKRRRKRCPAVTTRLRGYFTSWSSSA